MRMRYIALGLSILGSGLAASRVGWAQQAEAAPTDAKMIASAMSAAPAKIASAATIMVMEANGTMRTLRAGTNGFTCMPDNPATPGPDPTCMDKNSMEWLHAMLAHQAPPTTAIPRARTRTRQCPMSCGRARPISI